MDPEQAPGAEQQRPADRATYAFDTSGGEDATRQASATRLDHPPDVAGTTEAMRQASIASNASDGSFSRMLYDN